MIDFNTPAGYMYDRKEWLEVQKVEVRPGMFNIVLVIDGQYPVDGIDEMLAYHAKRLARVIERLND